MQDELLRWFAVRGRDLPWRRTRDPYAILVSEVMLQQTQAARVVPRYEAWLERWPTAEELAGAATADVIRAWQGLGYNRRALNLQRAAREVAAHGWPEDLTRLPGVGPYTAAAVASFAFGRAVLPEDVNVQRVHERTGASFDYTCGQALIDLGATVCIARVPRCGERRATPHAGGTRRRRRARTGARRARPGRERARSLTWLIRPARRDLHEGLRTSMGVGFRLVREARPRGRRGPRRGR